MWQFYEICLGKWLVMSSANAPRCCYDIWKVLECVFRPCLQYDDLFKTFTDCGSAFLRDFNGTRRLALFCTQNKTRRHAARRSPVNGNAFVVKLYAYNDDGDQVWPMTKSSTDTFHFIYIHIYMRIYRYKRPNRQVSFDIEEIPTKINISGYVCTDVWIFVLCTTLLWF